MTIDLATLGRRLREARENRGLSQEEVAKELGLPRTALVHIEAGNRSLSTLELADLARLYQRRPGDFFREGDSEEQDIVLAIHRLAPEFKNQPHVAREISRHVRICQEGVELRKLLGLPAKGGPPSYHLPAPRSAAEAVRQGQAIALEERRRLGLGDAPIPDMADLISAEGVWASGTDLPNEMSGLFLRHSSIGLVILVNFDHPRARKRFSYAHEFAHALLDREQSVTISQHANRNSLAEVRANAFAAAFLMPEGGVKAFLTQRNKGLASRESIPVYDAATEDKGLEVEALWRSAPGSQRIPFQLVACLAHHFRVSYQAATYRLKALGAVNGAAAKSLLAHEPQARSFLKLLKMHEDLDGTDKKGDRKPDRELLLEALTLAAEAFSREEISRAKLLEIGDLLGLHKDSLLEVIEA